MHSDKWYHLLHPHVSAYVPKPKKQKKKSKKKL
jgi:hypothetical protein